jgi:hypothetical protein
MRSERVKRAIRMLVWRVYYVVLRYVTNTAQIDVQRKTLKDAQVSESAMGFVPMAHLW